MKHLMSHSQGREKSVSKKGENKDKITDINLKSIIDEETYTHKLDGLLNRVAIQNKFSNRIVECNIDNIERRERAEKKLRELYQIRKQEQINEVKLRNLNSELNQQLQDLKQKLNKTIIELIEARRYIKSLEKRIKELEGQNIQVQANYLNSERLVIEKVNQVKQTLQPCLLSFAVKEYLERDFMDSSSSALYKFCLDSYKNKNYDHFFERLEEHLNDLSTLFESYRKSNRKSASYSINHSLVKLPYLSREKQFDINRKKKLHKRVKTLAPIKL